MNYAFPLICISFFNKYYILTQSMLIEPMSAEPQIQKANFWLSNGRAAEGLIRGMGLTDTHCHIQNRLENQGLPIYCIAQPRIKIAGRNIRILRKPDGTTLIESEEELKNLLIKVKEESEIVGLKLSIQKAKIMASGPITSWQIDGETVETVTDFIYLFIFGSKITADGDCSLEIKIWFFQWSCMDVKVGL